MPQDFITIYKKVLFSTDRAVATQYAVSIFLKHSLKGSNFEVHDTVQKSEYLNKMSQQAIK